MKKILAAALTVMCANICFAEVYQSTDHNKSAGFENPETVNTHDNAKKNTTTGTKDIYTKQTSLLGPDRLYMNTENSIKTPGGRTCIKKGSFLDCN